MLRFVYDLLVFGVLLIFTSASGMAQELKLFPGSRLDEKVSAEASKAAPGKESKVYTTSEGFEKVFAFYKGAYKQDTNMPPAGPKLVLRPTDSMGVLHHRRRDQAIEFQLLDEDPASLCGWCGRQGHPGRYRDSIRAQEVAGLKPNRPYLVK